MKTQKEYAQALGIHPVTLNSILKGKRKPSAKLALEIEELLKIPKEKLRPDIFKDKQPEH